MNAQLNVGDEIFLYIKRIGINGEGIGYYKKLAIFVDGVLPKENVLVKITKLYRGYATAELVELKTPSKDRVEPFCPYYTKCGGCSLQHVSYEATRDIKRDILMESITRYTKINPRSFEIKPTILMENPHNYRAKVNLPAKNGMHGAVFGLYAPNSEKFIRIKGCTVQNDSINQIMDEVAIKQVGFKPEPEYFMSEADVAKLITSGSLDAFLDCLDFAPPGVIDLIKTLSVKIPLTDLNKRQALKAKTGFDCDAALRHVLEEKEDDNNNASAAAAPAQRRVQPTETGRRTETPKYKVTAKTTTTEAVAVEESAK